MFQKDKMNEECFFGAYGFYHHFPTNTTSKRTYLHRHLVSWSEKL